MSSPIHLVHIVYNYFGEQDFATCCNELGMDRSCEKCASICRLKSSMFDKFWSECV